LLGKARWQQRATVGHVILIGKIEQRFQPGREQQHSFAPGIDLARQRTFGHGEGAAPLQFGFGAEQIGQAFRLVEIDPAMEKGAAGELARFRRAQTGQARQRGQHCRHHGTPAMEMQLSTVFPGRGTRTGQPEDHRGIERATVGGIDQGPERGAARRRQGAARPPAQVRLVDH
jgi:hypothetical protein